MNPIVLDLPGSQIISNNLYDTLSAEWLDEDLVFIRLPDGTKVDVGWHGDPAAGGYFKIVRYEKSWNSPREIVRTNCVQEVVTALKRFNSEALRSAIKAVSTTVPDYHAVTTSPAPIRYVLAIASQVSNVREVAVSPSEYRVLIGHYLPERL
jgi:hypothetical protein